MIEYTHTQQHVLQLAQHKLSEAELQAFAQHLTNCKKKYALILGGTQIKHSLSPFIHSYMARKQGHNMIYGYHIIQDRQQQMRDLLTTLIQDSNFLGANITMPGKLHIYNYLVLHGGVDASAQQTGAVNTVVKMADQLHGYNTDITGIIGPLAQHTHLSKQSNTAHILGAGGAARAVIVALTQLGYQYIHLYNRSPQRAHKLIDFFVQNRSLSTLPEIFYHQYLPGEAEGELCTHYTEPALLVNTLPLGYSHQDLNMPTSSHTLDSIGANLIGYIDIVYDSDERSTPLTQYIHQHHPTCITISGLDMLIHQAKQGFELRNPKKKFTVNMIQHILQSTYSTTT